MQDRSTEIAQIIGMRGPVLPIELGRALQMETLFVAAHLSEMFERGKVKISSVKVGSSPLYYLPGQEAQLQKFSDNLNEKDMRAYQLLLQKKVVRDIALDPLTRVALRSIKDFAIPLQVDYQGNTELFWKWYLLGEDEAKILIGTILGGGEEPAKESKPVKEEETGERVSQKQSQAKENPRAKEGQQVLQKKEMPPESLRPAAAVKAAGKKIVSDTFSRQLEDFFGSKKIVSLARDQVGKGELDFQLQVPSAVGMLPYYCKARDKKSINENDLAGAFVQGQLRKLPVLFITQGTLTKRAKEMLEKDFKGMQVQKL
ncbi:hypothetical protein HYV84_07960 [Candidatus Woesearchaeota archaeon]|nr:hypothetical protein [Candidatus Woesearchaeota archaeon]